MDKPTFHIYTDESGWDKKSGEFASVAAITVDTRKVNIPEVQERWKERIKEIKRKPSEMKFKNVNSRDDVEVVMKILKDINRGGVGGLYINVLTWQKSDKEDYDRSKQYGQEKTLAIMYCYLLKAVRSRKGKGNIIPQLYADKADQLNKPWKKSQEILARQWNSDLKKIKKRFPTPQANSKNYMFIQLADIMAGFMRHTFDKDYNFFRDKRKKGEIKEPKTNKEYKNDLCYKIEERLRSIGITFSCDGGCMSYSKDQPVSLWKFKKADVEKKTQDKTPKKNTPSPTAGDNKEENTMQLTLDQMDESFESPSHVGTGGLSIN